MRLRLTSPRQAPNLLVHVAAPAEVQNVEIDGKRARAADAGTLAAGGFAFVYYGLPSQGIELTLETTAGQSLALGMPVPPRPAATMPLQADFGRIGRDPTLVRIALTL